jgi:hypothetical protein
MPRRLVREAIDSLRARCRAAEEVATAAALAESRARAEFERTRQHCQQMLEATALELLEVKRELQARDRLAMAPRSDSLQSSAELQPAIDEDAEILFDRIDAVLAASLRSPAASFGWASQPPQTPAASEGWASQPPQTPAASFGWASAHSPLVTPGFFFGAASDRTLAQSITALNSSSARLVAAVSEPNA